MKIKSFLERKENVKQRLIKQINLNSDLIRKVGIKYSALDCKELIEDHKEFQGELGNRESPGQGNILDELKNSPETSKFPSSGLPLKSHQQLESNSKKRFYNDENNRNKGSFRSSHQNKGKRKAY